MHRRQLLTLGALAGVSARTLAAPASVITLPADFGAHPASRTEWWYVTGHLDSSGASARQWGFQVTFFRALTRAGAAAPSSSAFAATELVFAHAALTDLAQHRLRHDQRIARAGFGIARSTVGETDVKLRDWRLTRSTASGYRASVASESAGFAFELTLAPTQPVLLQGDAGLSRKGPALESTSHYYSEPQLAVQGTLIDTAGNTRISTTVTGRAWLDHEWSDAILPAPAVGWDWIGMNLDDGAALTAFRLRRADGSVVYAGGSFRAAGGTVHAFGPDEVVFTPGRVWQSAASKARYPVRWRVATPAGTYEVAALLDDQELDSRQSTGAFYWEGLSELLDSEGRRVGRGYLEMTGYADALRI